MAENSVIPGQGAAKNINKGQATREENAKKKIQQSFLKHLLYMNDPKTGRLIENPTVTDISFNGTDLYVQDNDIGRYKVDSPQDPRIIAGEKPLEVTATDVVNLGNNVQNVMGVQWNNNEPILVN